MRPFQLAILLFIVFRMFLFIVCRMFLFIVFRMFLFIVFRVFLFIVFRVFLFIVFRMFLLLYLGCSFLSYLGCSFSPWLYVKLRSSHDWTNWSSEYVSSIEASVGVEKYAHLFWALTLDRFCQLADPKLHHRRKELPAPINRMQLGQWSRSVRRESGRETYLLWRNRTQIPRFSNPQPNHYTEWATLDSPLKLCALQTFRL
jgi:hypothetical protein